ncbi:MAG: hypothetical protein H6827_09645 [Planctomycetes bacterium]|nr:hypothetical protein [Planctomycetota bacterium]
MHPRIAEMERKREMRRLALASWKTLAACDRRKGIRTWFPEDAFVAIPQLGVLAHHEIVGAYCEAYNAA